MPEKQRRASSATVIGFLPERRTSSTFRSRKVNASSGMFARAVWRKPPFGLGVAVAPSLIRFRFMDTSLLARALDRTSTRLVVRRWVLDGGSGLPPGLPGWMSVAVLGVARRALVVAAVGGPTPAVVGKGGSFSAG